MSGGINENYRFNKKRAQANSTQLNSPGGAVTNDHRQWTGEIGTATEPYNLEEMIAFIRCNPDAAMNVHQHLVHLPYEKRRNGAFVASTPQTPKRNLETSDNDGTHTAKQQRIFSNGKEKGAGTMRKPIVPTPMQSTRKVPQRTTAQPQSRLPFDQLRRAVSSNLPCFLIEYDAATSARERPSDVLAASMIEEAFREQGVKIAFSLVGHSGSKLKLGVNSKEAYAILASSDSWPQQIKNIPIKVTKPNFVPDAFALVVRYVPLQYSEDYVKEEIERNLTSAENVRRIQYRFERRTNDFRFTVKDLNEYNASLKLGRISIGNTFCTVTPFLTGNRMTYCTRCWCIGHMRDKCNHEHARCRICLLNLVLGQQHECSNIARCAQCDGEHHSLSSECEKVAEYRCELKEQVNQAVSTGKLQRLAPQGNIQAAEFQAKQEEFPELMPNRTRAAPWCMAAAQTRLVTDATEAEEATNMLRSINENLLASKKSIESIDEKLESMNATMNATKMDIVLHQNTLTDILHLLDEMIIAMSHQQPPATARGLARLVSDLQSKLKGDYMSRRQRNASPPPLLPQQTTNTTPNIESDPNMSR